MSKENAMRGQIPVIIGNDPDNIPINDEIVTQIIPIRYVQARQLIIDLSSLTQSPSIIANDAGNSIIVTDTQANIHHLVELVKAIDGSAEDVTEVRPFHLQYHDPVEVASLISSVFADQSNGQGGGQAPIRFGGFGGQGGFGGGGGLGVLADLVVVVAADRAAVAVSARFLVAAAANKADSRRLARRPRWWRWPISARLR